VNIKIEIKPGRELLNKVKGLMIIRGSNLYKWCAENGIAYPNAYAYLMGHRNGKKAKEWRYRMVEAAQQTGKTRKRDCYLDKN
jgi:hypothetical protein